MPQLYTILGGVAVLLVLSVFASKAAVRLGVPTLLFFLGLGIVAGSEGVGGLWFDYPRIAQGVGVAALVYILYAAGFDTNAGELRQQMWPALSLATVGVFVSCAERCRTNDWVPCSAPTRSRSSSRTSAILVTGPAFSKPRSPTMT